MLTFAVAGALLSIAAPGTAAVTMSWMGSTANGNPNNFNWWGEQRFDNTPVWADTLRFNGNPNSSLGGAYFQFQDRSTADNQFSIVLRIDHIDRIVYTSPQLRSSILTLASLGDIKFKGGLVQRLTLTTHAPTPDIAFRDFLGETFTLRDGMTSAAPESGTWALMIGGFGFVGAALRRRRVALSYS